MLIVGRTNNFILTIFIYIFNSCTNVFPFFFVFFNVPPIIEQTNCLTEIKTLMLSNYAIRPCSK